MSNKEQLISVSCRFVDTACSIAGRLEPVSNVACIVACTIDLWAFEPSLPDTEEMGSALQAGAHCGVAAKFLLSGASAILLVRAAASLAKVPVAFPSLLPVFGVAQGLRIVDNGLALTNEVERVRVKALLFAIAGAIVVALKVWGPQGQAQMAQLGLATAMLARVTLELWQEEA